MSGLVESEPSSSRTMDESLRSKQVSGLTINIQTAMEWKPQALQERTNSGSSTQNLYLASHSVPSSSYTPDTSYTFGVPNPTNLPNSGSSYSSSGFGSASNSYDPPLSSRQRRYFQPYSIPSTIHTPQSAASQPQSSTSSPARTQSRSSSAAAATAAGPQLSLNFRFPSNSKSSFSSRRPSSSTTRTVKNPAQSADPMTKRQRRYTVAEASLSSTLSYLLPMQDHLNSDIYASQREVDGLNRALAALNDKIKEIRERLEVLAAPTDDYEEWKSERWRSMKRLEILEAEKKSLESKLKELKRSKNKSSGQIIDMDAQRDQKQLRKERNLQKFLSGAVSPTRASFTGTSSTRKGRHRNHASLPVNKPRRMTMSDMQPMKLRSLSIEETLVERLRGRPIMPATQATQATLQGPGDEAVTGAEVTQAPWLNQLRSPVSPSTLQSPLPSVDESAEDEDEGEDESGLASSTSLVSEDVVPHLQPRPLSTGHIRSNSIYDPTTGTVVIFRNRSDSSLEVDIKDMQVEIPAYAQDLFAHFDEERGEFDIDLGKTLSSTLPSRQRPFSLTPVSTPSSSPLKKMYHSLPGHHSSPTKPAMPKPSPVGMHDASPTKARPRPDSMVESLQSASPSRVSFVDPGEESKAKEKDVAIGKKLRRKLSKKIFMR
ncbi:hypothetical protein WG66_010280 [Moniliophthora roreri]|nr:hypothetical protein WG66_010280 [Moniliophthora roreri]